LIRTIQEYEYLIGRELTAPSSDCIPVDTRIQSLQKTWLHPGTAMICGYSADSQQNAQERSSVSSKSAIYVPPLLSKDWSSSTQFAISTLNYQSKSHKLVQEDETHYGKVLHQEYHRDRLTLQFLALLLVGSPDQEGSR
jgi:hypothetical protein